MTILVNYYTCSYGDSLVNMFNGNSVSRVNGIARCNFDRFVEPEFYNKDSSAQAQDWELCQQLKFQAVPCHRQHGFDFASITTIPIKVVTVKLNDIDFLAPRFKKIHLDSRGKGIKHVGLHRLLETYPDRYVDIVTKDYSKWLSNNMLTTDVVFQFDWIHDLTKVREFCEQHNLGFNNDWLENIQQDLEQYAMSKH